MGVLMLDLYLFEGGFELLYVASNDHNICALLCQQLCKTLSHALGASSDDHGLVQSSV